MVDACLPKDEAGNFIASQERSDVVHDSPGLPGGKNAGDEPGTEANEGQGLPGLAGELRGAKVEDLTPKTKLQSYYDHDYESFLAVLKKNGKKLAIDPARREPEHRAEFEGSMGKLLPLRERALEDG